MYSLYVRGSIRTKNFASLYVGVLMTHKIGLKDGRLSLTNGFLAVPDEKTPPGSEKISLKSLYKMFNDTKSHRLPSLQSLSALNIFFGADVKLSKDAIAELYKNLLLETLSGRQ